MQELANGLLFPEGPTWLGDGSLIVVEIAAGRLTRIAPDGSCRTVAELGGGPNGAAMGPDGRCYVCNNGGFVWRERDGARLPAGTAADYVSGSLQAVDIHTGAVETLYTACQGQRLNGPNDLVFDRSGGFWFTDHGHAHGRHRDRGAVYYARPDGSRIEQAIYPLEMPNGIALSPSGLWVYFRPINGLRYSRIRSADLADASLSQAALSKRVEYLGDGVIGGGLAVDAKGRLFAGDLEHASIMMMTPGPGGKWRSVLFANQPDRLAWADGFAISQGWLYISNSRLNESFFGNNLPRTGPFSILRVRLPD